MISDSMAVLLHGRAYADSYSYDADDVDTAKPSVVMHGGTVVDLMLAMCANKSRVDVSMVRAMLPQLLLLLQHFGSEFSGCYDVFHRIVAMSGDEHVLQILHGFIDGRIIDVVAMERAEKRRVVGTLFTGAAAWGYDFSNGERGVPGTLLVPLQMLMGAGAKPVMTPSMLRNIIHVHVDVLEYLLPCGLNPRAIVEVQSEHCGVTHAFQCALDVAVDAQRAVDAKTRESGLECCDEDITARARRAWRAVEVLLAFGAEPVAHIHVDGRSVVVPALIYVLLGNAACKWIHARLGTDDCWRTPYPYHNGSSALCALLGLMGSYYVTETFYGKTVADIAVLLNAREAFSAVSQVQDWRAACSA
jgi:hypothetical protein